MGRKKKRAGTRTSRPPGTKERGTIEQSEVRWNNQEWPYFDFNSQCPPWNKRWERMEQRIRRYREDCDKLDESEADERWGEFMRTFRLAGKAAFKRILANGVLAGMKKTEDFRAWVFEHHDRF